MEHAHVCMYPSDGSMQPLEIRKMSVWHADLLNKVHAFMVKPLNGLIYRTLHVRQHLVSIQEGHAWLKYASGSEKHLQGLHEHQPCLPVPDWAHGDHITLDLSVKV